MGGTVRYPRKAQGLIALAVAGIALAIVATSASAASTRAEYISQVDPICANELAATKRTFGGVAGDLRNGRFKQAASKFRRTTKVFRNGVDGVAAVMPPAADVAVINQWVQMLRNQIPPAKRVANLLGHNARPGRINRALTRLFKLSDQTQALVKDYGFTSCNGM
jgi:hypothetical protein